MIVDRPLVSNGYTLSSAPDRLGLLTPSDPTLPVEVLQAQFKAQGYLWLKGLLDRDEVLEFRRRFFAAFAETGLLAPGSDPVDGIYSGGEGIDRQKLRRLVAESVRWASYEAFCLAAPIWQLL